MTQPRRLRDRGADRFERALLRSADLDGPSDRARHKALAALGIGAGGAVGAGASSSAAAAGSVASGTAAGGAVVKVGGAVLVAKWIGAALFVAGATAGGVYYATQPGAVADSAPRERAALATSMTVPTVRIERPAERPELAAVPLAQPSPPLPGDPTASSSSAGRPPPRVPLATLSPPPQVSPTPVSPGTEAPVVPTAPPLVASAAPTAGTAAPTSTTTPPPPTAPAPALSPLAAETALIDAARDAARTNDPGRTLRLLDERDRRFPRGVFGEEATVLRVEALVQSGDRAGANDLASRFLAGHPASPHADRIRSLTNP